MPLAAVFAPLSRPRASGLYAGQRWLPSALLGLCALSGAHAQMVPPQEHAWRQAVSTHFTSVRLPWGGSSTASDGSGPGLQAKGRQLWPHWEGRIGLLIDQPVTPLQSSLVLAQPSPAGLRLRSLHILSDYHLNGGFRATAGLLRGQTGQAWWSGGEQGGGLNLSLQRLDSLRLPGMDDGDKPQTLAYLGAGYSSRLGETDRNPGSRFNADVGWSASPLHDNLSVRPMVKVSVGYAF